MSKVKILYPVGCYGNYLARCIYYYTTLGPGTQVLFDFDDSGSSHAFRDDILARQSIECGHPGIMSITDHDAVVAILPDHRHCLDYYNNQFAKQNRADIVEHLRLQLPLEEIETKLKAWDYHKPFGHDVPVWILREFLSFWMTDSWKQAYNRDSVLTASHITVEAEEIVEGSFKELLYQVTGQLGLDFTAEPETIDHNHREFRRKQQYLYSQFRCTRWVDSLIDNETNGTILIKTIFDEAYIQHLLREHGYGIRCDGVERFPNQLADMQKLIYKL